MIRGFISTYPDPDVQAPLRSVVSNSGVSEVIAPKNERAILPIYSDLVHAEASWHPVERRMLPGVGEPILTDAFKWAG